MDSENNKISTEFQKDSQQPTLQITSSAPLLQQTKQQRLKGNVDNPFGYPSQNQQDIPELNYDHIPPYQKIYKKMQLESFFEKLKELAHDIMQNQQQSSGFQINRFFFNKNLNQQSSFQNNINCCSQQQNNVQSLNFFNIEIDDNIDYDAMQQQIRDLKENKIIKKANK